MLAYADIQVGRNEVDHQTRQRPTYRAKVTGRHAITLPALLCRYLNIEVGDTVELEEIGGQAVLRPAGEESGQDIRPARGILRDHFRDWEDILRFIEEERAGWDKQDNVRKEEDEPDQRPGKPSNAFAGNRLSSKPRSR